MEKEIKLAPPKVSAIGNKSKGGRPRKATAQVRGYKHTLFLSEGEEAVLQRMIAETGLPAAELFRHSLLGKGLRIPKARIAPEEVMEILTDFKKKSSLIKLLAHRERDFNAEERKVLIGSGSSMRTAVERLQRSIFLSLDQADELEEIKALAELFRQTLDLTKGRKGFEKADWVTMEKLLQRLVHLLQGHYQYLTLTRS